MLQSDGLEIKTTWAALGAMGAFVLTAATFLGWYIKTQIRLAMSDAVFKIYKKIADLEQYIHTTRHNLANEIMKMEARLDAKSDH
jgi:nitric oxide synthase oxygenase domain/subunit